MRTNGLLAFGLVAALAACGEKATAPASAPSLHEHRAPHGGALQVLGDETAHVELVLDTVSGRLTAYVLDGEAEKPVRIAQPSLRLAVNGAALELTAVESVLTGEKRGETSQFEGTSRMLVGVKSFDGTLETITAHGMKFDAVRIGFPGGNEEGHDAAK